MPATSYALGLGANRGRPKAMPARAAAALAAAGVRIVAMSRTIETAPLGPGTRRYANAALVVETGLAPPALLALVKRIERDHGRRGGRRWGDRALDIDILLWSGGRWRSRALVVPHRALGRRQFMLDPLNEIAAGWRVTGAVAVRHLAARLTARPPLHRSAALGARSSVGRATDF